jgi:hypothetical protein
VTPTPTATATQPGAPTATPTATATATRPPLPPGGGSLTWYFAEGYTADGFDEYLTILNPNAAAAQVTITYFLGDGSTRTHTLTVPATSRRTVAVHDAAEGVGRGKEVSARVESTNGVGVYVERPMYFRYSSAIDGGHVGRGQTAPAPVWHFAEGYTTAGFDQYLTILNPDSRAAAVTITYFLTDGTTQTRSLTVAPTSRRTIVVHETAEGVGRGKEVSARVESTNGVDIIAERPMYFRYTLSDGSGIVDGGHLGEGARAPAVAWHFAEGYTGADFDEYLTILNPDSRAAAVTITYYLADGSTRQEQLMVGATSRATVAVHERTLAAGRRSAPAPTPTRTAAQGVGRGQTVAATVASTNGVGLVVERPIYFRYLPDGGGAAIDGGHNGLGATAPATRWSFAEGYTGPGFDQYLTILNPSPNPAAVTITYFLTGGAPQSEAVTVGAGRRATVAVHRSVGRGREVAARVESAGGVGIVAERVMYFRYSPSIDGGSAALGQTP